MSNWQRELIISLINKKELYSTREQSSMMGYVGGLELIQLDPGSDYVNASFIIILLRGAMLGEHAHNDYKWKNHFSEMKGDVGMSLHEKEGEQEDA